MAQQKTQDTRQTVDDAVRLEAGALLRTARSGALALNQPKEAVGGPAPPLLSRIGVATDIDGVPVFPVSDLSGRNEALAQPGGGSLLLGEAGKGDPLAHPRLVLSGTCRRCEGADHERVRGRYLARHPKAGLYIDFKDFSLWRFEIAAASHIGGFGRAYEMVASDLVCAPSLVEGWWTTEPGAREHMNDDHADAVALYATGLAGGTPGSWQLTGIDPAGIDLALGDDHRRVWFDVPLSSVAAMRPKLVSLVGKARDALQD